MVWANVGPLSSLPNIRALYPSTTHELGIADDGGDIRNALLTTWNRGLRITLYPFVPQGRFFANSTFGTTIYTQGHLDEEDPNRWYHHYVRFFANGQVASTAGNGLPADNVVVYARPLLTPWILAGPLQVIPALKSVYPGRTHIMGTLYRNKPTQANPIANTQPADIQRVLYNTWSYGNQYKVMTYPSQPQGDYVQNMTLGRHVWTVGHNLAPDKFNYLRQVYRFPKTEIWPANTAVFETANLQPIYVRARSRAYQSKPSLTGAGFDAYSSYSMRETGHPNSFENVRFNVYNVTHFELGFGGWYADFYPHLMSNMWNRCVY